MSSPIRPVSVTDATGTTVRVKHVVGVDESGNENSTDGICVTVAVRTRRRNDHVLLRSLVQNGLQPFKHKSMTLVRYEGLSKTERSENVAAFIKDLDETPITWAAVVSSKEYSHERRAAATSMSVKKAITSALEQEIFGGNTDPAALLHDGNYDEYGQYEYNLRKQVAADFDSSFQANICPVHPVFLQHADRTYPQSNAADYVASYLRDQLIAGNSVVDVGYDNIYELDPSWVRQAGQPAPLYELETLRPIKESNIRSRVLCWLLGKGVPRSPDPTTHDPLEELAQQIEDDVVREYLLYEV